MEFNTIITDILYTLSRVVITTLISWICSIGTGVLLHKIRFLYRLLLPVINFFRQISPFVWLPFAIMLVGLGEFPIGIVLFTAMFFPGVIMVFEIIDAFPKEVYEEAVTSGASHLHLLLKIELPILWKQLINVFRLLWSVGWSTVIAAEMLGVSRGLGFRLLDYRYLLEYRMMLIYVLIIGIIGIASDRLIRAISFRSSWN
ncbi:MAG: ABC transporter permease subunit [Candidatus Cloacimonadaceae bacterium]